MAAPLLENVGAYAAGKGKQAASSAAREARRARLPTGDRRYQGVILAEFVTAALIVALAPIARGKAAQDTGPGPSPYGPDDIKQLAGIGAVYFVLALLSSGKYGRLSAWLGGLILVAIGLSETTSGGLAGIFGIFQPASKSAGTGEGSGINPGAGQFPVFIPGQGVEITNPDATGIFPVILPGGQVVPANVVEPTPSGAPSFTQQVTQAGTGALVQTYQGGPGVVTTDTGTQLI